MVGINARARVHGDSGLVHTKGIRPFVRTQVYSPFKLRRFVTEKLFGKWNPILFICKLNK